MGVYTYCLICKSVVGLGNESVRLGSYEVV